MILVVLLHSGQLSKHVGLQSKSLHISIVGHHREQKFILKGLTMDIHRHLLLLHQQFYPLHVVDIVLRVNLDSDDAQI